MVFCWPSNAPSIFLRSSSSTEAALILPGVIQRALGCEYLDDADPFMTRNEGKGGFDGRIAVRRVDVGMA